jgi:alpha-mannosidase
LDPAQAARFGREARSFLEVSVISGNGKTASAKKSMPPDQASLAQAGPENLVISAVKAAEDGQGLIVRVLETAGRASEGNLTLPLTTITSAVECNAVEACAGALASDAHSVKFHITPHQVRTIRVMTK